MPSLEPQKIKLPNIKKTVCIASGKGGVGKTFVACNLAITLAKLGERTGLFDANICCPDVFRALGINTKLSPTADEKIIPVEKWGIKIVSMAGLCSNPDEPIAWRGPILSKILQQILKGSLWGELDTLVIDLPPTTSDNTLTVLQNFAIDGVIIVTTPQDLALIDAQRTIHVAQLLKIPVLGIMENMRGEAFGEGGASRIAEMYRIPFLGSIPMKKQIATTNETGTPIVLQSEEIEIIFTKLARPFIKHVGEPLKNYVS